MILDVNYKNAIHPATKRDGLREKVMILLGGLNPSNHFQQEIILFTFLYKYILVVKKHIH